MTRHLLRLVWNRKRQNLLLTLEIFLSFVGLFGVVFFASTYYYAWRQPLGFEVADQWIIQVGYPQSGPDFGANDEEREAKLRAAETVRQLIAVVKDLPNVSQLAASWPSRPYNGGGWFGGAARPGGPVHFSQNHIVTDDFAEVAGLTVTRGRWFSRDDAGARPMSVVINERFARELFGDEEPVGEVLSAPEPGEADPESRPPLPVYRVIGVIEDYRHAGEFEMPRNVMLMRMSLAPTPPPAEQSTYRRDALPNVLMVRLTPDTTAAFEESLVGAMQGVAPDWSFDVAPLAVQREEALWVGAVPLMIFGIVAAFLLLMVALGLTGVMWQSVTRRTREFGLRRAKGATAHAVRRQVVVELLLLTSLAVLVGIALLVQIPVVVLAQFSTSNMPADMTSLLTPQVWVASMVISATIIYAVTLLCGWYPSRLATAIQPAEALHYE